MARQHLVGSRLQVVALLDKAAMEIAFNTKAEIDGGIEIQREREDCSLNFTAPAINYLIGFLVPVYLSIVVLR